MHSQGSLGIILLHKEDEECFNFSKVSINYLKGKAYYRDIHP